MPSTIEQTKGAILKHGGRASKQQIARELKISLDYASLILGDLRRKGEVAFSDGFYALTVAKKDVIQNQGPKKSATPSKRVGRRLKRLKRVKKTPKESLRDPTGQAKKPRNKKRAPHLLCSILGIDESLARTLEKAGYGAIEYLAEAPISKLMAAAKLELQTAAQLINQARKIK